MTRFTVGTTTVEVEHARELAHGQSDVSEYDAYLDPDEIWRVGFTIRALNMRAAEHAAERIAICYLVGGVALPPLVCHYCGDERAHAAATEAFGEPVCSDCGYDAHNQRADCSHDDAACLLRHLASLRPKPWEPRDGVYAAEGDRA